MIADLISQKHVISTFSTSCVVYSHTRGPFFLQNAKYSALIPPPSHRMDNTHNSRGGVSVAAAVLIPHAAGLGSMPACALQSGWLRSSWREASLLSSNTYGGLVVQHFCYGIVSLMIIRGGVASESLSPTRGDLDFSETLAESCQAASGGLANHAAAAAAARCRWVSLLSGDGCLPEIQLL